MEETLHPQIQIPKYRTCPRQDWEDRSLELFKSKKNNDISLPPSCACGPILAFTAHCHICPLESLLPLAILNVALRAYGRETKYMGADFATTESSNTFQNWIPGVDKGHSTPLISVIPQSCQCVPSSKSRVVSRPTAQRRVMGERHVTTFTPSSLLK